MDDLLIHSMDEVSHLNNVKEIIRRLAANCLKIKLTKCIALASEIKFLGHVVLFNSIKPDEEKIAAIKNFKLSETMEKLQSFMGLCGFYRKFIKSYASIDRPIYQLMVTKEVYISPLKIGRKRKKEKVLTTVKSKFIIVELNETAIQAFETLKAALCSDNVLVFPDFDKPFILVTDACDFAYGAVLCQEVDGVVKPVAYFSKQMNKAQTKYSTSEKELLAIVMSVHFYSFLYGRFFTVHSDHQPLKWLLSKKGPFSSRLARWILRLNVYEFEIRYKPGALNGNADALSRMADMLNTIDDNDELLDDFKDHVICSIEVAANEEFLICFDSDYNHVSCGSRFGSKFGSD